MDHIPDKKLRSLTIGTLKLAGLVSHVVQSANVFEDEEFQPYNFNFSLAEERNISGFGFHVKTGEKSSCERFKVGHYYEISLVVLGIKQFFANSKILLLIMVDSFKGSWVGWEP